MTHPLPPRGYRSLVAHRTFTLLWTAQAISTFGDALYDVALLWYVLDATRSAVAASGIAVGATLGRLLGSLSASALLDRVSPRRVMLSTSPLVRHAFLVSCGGIARQTSPREMPDLWRHA